MIPATLSALLEAARRREWLITLLATLPWLMVAALVAALRDADVWLLPTLALLLLAVSWQGGRLRQALRRRSAGWLLARLEDRRPDAEDSADLIGAEPSRLTPLAALQRQRVLDQLAGGPLPDLRRALPWRVLAGSALLAGLALPAMLHRPDPGSPPLAVEAPPSAAVMIQSMVAELTVTPPDYTGLPVRRSEQLSVEVPQDSLVRWQLRFSTQPRSARLEFVDGRELALRKEPEGFIAETVLSRSTLYRVRLDGAPGPDGDALQRIDVISDRPPQLIVRSPERTLTVLEFGQRSWSIEIDAEDDYGLGAAELTLTLAQGSGEQVTVSERTIPLQGEGDDRRRRYRHLVDLEALGFARGDDLIARLDVSDRRSPVPQRARSAALILRWPYQPAAEGSGVEGLVQRALPAYFRSQRQIIIDTEALIADRRTLDEDSWMARSDAIGVDQRILRMRYGQFLGEESESGDLPGSGPRSDAPDTDDHEHDDAHRDLRAVSGHALALALAARSTTQTVPQQDAARPGDPHADHGHDHGPSSAQPADSGGVFGEAGSLLAEVGHLHDIAEAATLLDPRTRELLRGALREMWQAEGHLRLGQPQAALPFEYRALELIKQVQQANRIYLARVGLELPAVDFSRRLSGEGRPRQRPVDPLVPAASDDPPLADWWQALDRSDALPLDAIASWLAAPPGALADPLAALTDVDTLRRQPDCTPCRQRLQQQLWPLLPMPAARPTAARDGDSQGYLDALPSTGAPR